MSNVIRHSVFFFAALVACSGTGWSAEDSPSPAAPRVQRPRATGAAERAGEELLLPAPAGSFSIVVIPDTQAYRGKDTKATPTSDEPVTNAVFDAHTQWIVANLRTQRIVFVSHVGDIVDRNVPEQWAVARQIMDRLHQRVPDTGERAVGGSSAPVSAWCGSTALAAALPPSTSYQPVCCNSALISARCGSTALAAALPPYGIALGNHDLKAGGDTTLFQQHFPAKRFAGCPWYGGTPSDRLEAKYGNNANSFQLFSAGGLDFVFLHLECNAPDVVLQWADRVLADHPSRRAIVASHMGLGPLLQPKKAEDFFAAPKGRMQWKKVHGALGNTPQQMWDKCFRRHANLFLILSGDQSRTQALRLVSRNDAGQPVHEVLSDYMQTAGTGDCWLRLLRFQPTENRIDVFTVDSRTGRLCSGTKLVPQRDAHQFTLEYAMTGSPSQRVPHSSVPR